MITPFSLVLFGVSLSQVLAAGFAWRRRAVQGGGALAVLFAAIAVWCFFSAMETTSTTEAQRYLWSAMSYIGLCNVTPLLLVFAVRYSDLRWRLTGPLLAVIWSVPAATLVLAFTNGMHHLIWTGITPGPVSGTNTVIYHHGPWFPVEQAWFLLLSVVASALILRVAIRSARLYVLQTVTLLLCILAPWAGLLLFVLPDGPWPGLDTTSLGFAVSALLVMTAVFRLRLLDLVPQARSTLVERMPDGFLVLDARDRIIDINPTARRLLGIEQFTMGMRLAEAIPVMAPLLDIHDNRGERDVVATLPSDRALELSISSVASPSGRVGGRLLLIRDVSERRQAEREKERLIADLRGALASVKKLSGLLPICASCKKIRDDQGYWHQVESYMKDHSEIEFSHSICPECAARLYPGLLDSPDEGTGPTG